MGPLEGQRDLPPQSALDDDSIEPICRAYSELRYQLMPYTYTLAWQARATGLPFMRALWLHYPDDARAVGAGDQFLWGRDLLVAPVYIQGAESRDVYLPDGRWWDWWTNEPQAGGRTIARAVDLATMPLYARAGAIIPFDPVRQYVDEPVEGPTTIKIFRGADGDFTLYEDDGVSQEYLSGRATWTRMTWDDEAGRLTLQPAPPEGATNLPVNRAFRVELIPDGATRDVNYTGERVVVTFNR
jgi:alpha-glucosidase/alpha-D-xyloside xylohydrolase